MLRITERTAQALRILEVMFERPDDVWASAVLVERTGLTSDVIVTRNQQMGIAGFVRTFRGAGGGARIEKDDLTLWDVSLAVENPAQFEESEPWQHLSDFFERTMKRTKVRDLIKERI